jgi:hypothetical protein
VGKDPAVDQQLADKARERTGAVKTPISGRAEYQVKIGDKTHRVTVEPA